MSFYESVVGALYEASMRRVFLHLHMPYGGIEYRYLANEQSFFDGFIQYGFIHNKRFPTNTRLYSFGLGFNMLLPIGLMSFQISNGSQIGETFQFKETKIHWGIVAKF